jgi:hypothetical protein
MLFSLRWRAFGSSGKRRETAMIRAEMNKIETKATQKMKQKLISLERLNRINKSLTLETFRLRNRRLKYNQRLKNRHFN